MYIIQTSTVYLSPYRAIVGTIESIMQLRFLVPVEENASMIS